ncbi:MAG: TetR/AcrR family transcriptional regulator [Bacteroidetes bacterium]|nr:TetR/AcrR family transcriptional regulator [Bacteroidota bacterium]
MKREAIIDAAEQLFAEKGYDGTSLRELSARAGINVAMVSYYFGSKEELFKTIIELRSAQARAFLESLNRNESIDPMTRLELYVDHYLEQRITNRNFYRIVHRELSLDQRSTMQEFLTKALWKLRSELQRILLDGQRQGVFADVDVDLTIATLIGLVNLVMNKDQFANKLFNGDPTSRTRKKTQERIANHIKRMLRSMLLMPTASATPTTSVPEQTIRYTK